VRVRHLRGADAGLSLLSRTSAAVDACALGLISPCSALHMHMPMHMQTLDPIR